MAHPEQIAGYRIIRLLAEGGMASVYLAEDPKIQRHVAIKLIKEGLDNPELRERFQREAQSAGRLQHQNIVTLLQFGEYESRPYIVMEYISGDTLAKVIEQRPVLSLAHKLRIVEDLCRGLAHAHKAGVVHRDIKPSNVMVNSDGVVKLLDFGIARIGDQSNTVFGMIVGTLHYMSPEQINSGTVDFRSDIFSVGLVLYELLTYERAFPGDTVGVLHKIVTAAPTPIDKVIPGIGEDVVAILDRALQKDSGSRYPDLHAMRSDLAKARARLHRSTGTDESADEGPIHLQNQASSSPDTPTEVLTSSRVAQLLINARQLLDEKQYLRAIAECDQALALDASQGGAAEVRRQAQGALQEVEARNQLAAARAAVLEKHFDEAARVLDQIDALRASGEFSADLVEEVGELRAEVEASRRTQRIDAVVDAAQQALAKNDFAAVEHGLNGLAAADRNDEGVLRVQVALEAARVKASSPPPKPAQAVPVPDPVTPAPQRRPYSRASPEQSARQNPAWLVPAAAGAGIIVLVALIWFMLPNRHEVEPGPPTTIVSALSSSPTSVPTTTSTRAAGTTTTVGNGGTVRPTTVVATTTVPVVTSVQASTTMQATTSAVASTAPPTTSVPATSSQVTSSTRPTSVQPLNLDQDAQAIQATLRLFIESYTSLDEAALRRVYPTAPDPHFNDVRRMEIELQSSQLALNGDRATVTCRRFVRATMKVGRPQVTTVQTTFQLRRGGPSGWTIESVR